MDQVNVLRKFSRYDLREVTKMSDEINVLCQELNTITSKYNINTYSDLLNLRIDKEGDDLSNRFLLCTSKLKFLQKELDYLFLEAD